MSEANKAQYQILSQLKRIEEKIARLKTQAAHIPQELSTLESALKERKTEFDHAKTVFDGHQQSLRRAESDLKEKEEALRKAESKMMEVKTNEEYQAAMKENEGQKKEKVALEEKVLTLMNQLEEHRKVLKDAEGKYKQFEGAQQGDKKKLETDRVTILRGIEEQTQVRDQAAAQLTPELKEMYRIVTIKTKGVPISKAENCTCLTCNMRMRAQLFNEILGFKTFHRCPNCGRILVHVEDETQAGNPTDG